MSKIKYDNYNFLINLMLLQCYQEKLKDEKLNYTIKRCISFYLMIIFSKFKVFRRLTLIVIFFYYMKSFEIKIFEFKSLL